MSKNKATYCFRGIEVFSYDLDSKHLDIGQEAFMCHFISEDYKLMSQFLLECYNHHKTGTEVKSIEVD